MDPTVIQLGYSFAKSSAIDIQVDKWTRVSTVLCLLFWLTAYWT